MNLTSFSDFKEEIMKMGITNPRIEFNNKTIKVIAQPDIYDLSDLTLALFFSSLFLFSDILLIPSIICFILFGHRLFLNFKGCGIFTIDFDTKTITAKNRFFLINLVRKVFGITCKNQFSSVKQISYTDKSLIDKLGYLRFTKRYFLFLETYKDIPIAISQFNKEEDAKTIVSILRKFLLNKEKIIA